MATMSHSSTGTFKRATHGGWVPRRSLRTTLPRMVETLKGDPLPFYRENELEAPSWLKPQANAHRREAPHAAR